MDEKKTNALPFASTGTLYASRRITLYIDLHREAVEEKKKRKYGTNTCLNTQSKSSEPYKVMPVGIFSCCFVFRINQKGGLTTSKGNLCKIKVKEVIVLWIFVSFLWTQVFIGAALLFGV